MLLCPTHQDAHGVHPSGTLKMGGLAEASTTPAPSLPFPSFPSFPPFPPLPPSSFPPSLPAPDPGVPGHSGDVHHPSAPGSDASDSNGTTSKVPDTPEASSNHEDTRENSSRGGGRKVPISQTQPEALR